MLALPIIKASVNTNYKYIIMNVVQLNIEVNIKSFPNTEILFKFPTIFSLSDHSPPWAVFTNIIEKFIIPRFKL